mmetsp:Transcript_48841/g.125947  ORF Transcript_48841/g.125947 Transcript_48841/m.125947 type:complete len:161 (-) Transcript_48841:89-571(-)
MAQQRPILIFYHIPADGDEADAPNAFPIVKPGGGVTLKDVCTKFPLPGTYTFRFKTRFGDAAVWMDATQEDQRVPLMDGKVVAKVNRVAWGAAPAAQPAAQAMPQPAPERPPPVQTAVPDMGLFHDAPAAAPAAQGGYPQSSRPPPPQAGKQDDFDMLFG